MPKIRTIVEIRRELRQKESQLARLAARRDKAVARLAKIDRKIAMLGGEVPSGRWGKGKGKGNGRKIGRARRHARGKPLIGYVAEVLGNAKKGMRVKEIAQAVTDAGYRSASTDFYGIVATTVRNTKVFRKIKRGVYRLKD